MSSVEATDLLAFETLAADAVLLPDLMLELIPDLLGYFVNRLDNRDDAADAVAETLLVLWRKENAVPRDREHARQYSFGIARKVLQVVRRSHRRHNALADRLRAVVREEIVEGPELDVELRAALGTLKDRDRELVLMVAWEGFSIAEAGRIVGIRPEAARARYSRARSRLREVLSTGG